MKRFWEAGVDFTRDNCLASYLATSTRNKPAYGWAKRHSGDPRVAYQLALALGDAVSNNREKAVSLLLWAGADPHRKMPSLEWGSGIEDDPDDDRQSAIEATVQMGHGKLLKHLRPDPAVDDFEELYAWVCDPDAVGHLTAQVPPSDWSKAIVRNVAKLAWGFRDTWTNRACLEFIFDKHGGRLVTLEHHECRDLRRDLLKWNDHYGLKWILRLLAKPRHCDPAIYTELTRTPAIRKRMTQLGLLKPRPSKRLKRTRRR